MSDIYFEPDEVVEDLRNNTTIEESLGIKFPKTVTILGEGTRGSVVLLENDKVMKITDDSSEAKVAAQIKDKNIRGLYHSYGGFKLKNTGQIENDDIYKLYFVIMDKLSKDESRGYAALASLGDAKFEVRKKLRKTLETPVFASALYDDKFFEIALEFLEDRKTKADKDAIELLHGMHWLNTNSIDFQDLHPGNIMYEGKKAVIIDLGYSTGAKGRPKVFENSRLIR